MWNRKRNKKKRQIWEEILLSGINDAMFNRALSQLLLLVVILHLKWWFNFGKKAAFKSLSLWGFLSCISTAESASSIERLAKSCSTAFFMMNILVFHIFNISIALVSQQYWVHGEVELGSSPLLSIQVLIMKVYLEQKCAFGFLRIKTFLTIF